jgi:hypothetical protein
MNIYNEEEAVRSVRYQMNHHRNAYLEKMADLHKVIISLSGVMLSIMGTFFVGKEVNVDQSYWLILLILPFLLLSVLFGIAALHGRSEIHQKIVLEISVAVKKSSSFHEANEKLKNETTELGGLYKYVGDLAIFTFCVSLITLTIYAMLKV